MVGRWSGCAGAGRLTSPPGVPKNSAYSFLIEEFSWLRRTAVVLSIC